MYQKKKMNEFRMRQRIIQQILLVLYFLLSYSRVQGEKKLSELEDAELEKQLKLLNKPAVKIIKVIVFGVIVFIILLRHYYVYLIPFAIKTIVLFPFFFFWFTD